MARARPAMWNKRDAPERVTVVRRSLEAVEAELARERRAGRGLQAQLLREARAARRAREETSACRAGQEEALRALASLIANERHAVDALRGARALVATRERELAEAQRGYGEAEGRIGELERALLELRQEREGTRAEREGWERRLADAERARDEARARLAELEARLAARPVVSAQDGSARRRARPWLALAIGSGVLASALLPALVLALVVGGSAGPAGAIGAATPSVLAAAEAILCVAALVGLVRGRRHLGRDRTTELPPGAGSPAPPARGRAEARG